MAKRAPKPEQGELDEAVAADQSSASANEEQAAAATAAQEPADEPSNEAGDTQSMQARIEELQAKADEHWDRLLRTQAEMENLRKRSQRDVENAHKFALEGFAGELLGVRDSLEMGLSAAAESDDVASIREGTELTLKLLSQAMEKHNIKEINPVGEKFNPEHHQAMNIIEDSEAEPNSVVMVIQKGYLLNDRLLRPALVSVAR